MLKNTLIIDKRKELSIKYKKLIEGLDNFVLIVHTLQGAMKAIQENEPDLIIVSDSLDESLAEFCKKLRVLTFNTRPVIVAMSKSSELEDKLQVLENGADDFLSEPINSEEFKMRIKAHLRREHESNIESKTLLPSKNYSLKTLKRVIVKAEPWACLYLSIQNFNFYKEIYSELASDKLIQTFCAIISSTLEPQDFLGHLSQSEFLIITHPMRAEKIASYLTFAFDMISSKFYSSEDAKRGYAILQGDEKAGRRSEFVFTTIGVVSNEFKKYTSVQQVLSSLLQIHNLAKKPSGSSYAIERPKLSASDSVLTKSFNNKVWVLEDDEALSYLLATAIKLQGYEVEALETPQAIISLISTFELNPPAVIVVDAGSLESLAGLEICKVLKKNEILAKSKIVLTSIIHDKELILNSGADLYLPKPYELAALMDWIKIFIREYNAR